MQVSFRALAKSPGLAAAARAELGARQRTSSIRTDDGGEVCAALSASLLPVVVSHVTA